MNVPYRSRTVERHLSDGSSNDDNGDKEPVAFIDKPPMPAGSHDELMYALGVNLARQLGDVRPLVENSAELACVAKGLLDTVVGRFSEEGQVDLLKRRKEDLNSVILSRAYVVVPTCVLVSRAFAFDSRVALAFCFLSLSIVLYAPYLTSADGCHTTNLETQSAMAWSKRVAICWRR